VISRVHSFVLQGIDALSCEIEADLNPSGLPKTTVVGLPDAAVRESIERVRAALLSCGFRYPTTRITINLAPADVRKEGPVYDLPFAVALLRADGTIQPFASGGLPLDETLIAGELALDGRVRPVRGVISLALLARKRGVTNVVVPRANAKEAAAVDGVNVYGVDTLGQVVTLFNAQAALVPEPTLQVETILQQVKPLVDFAEIKGQEAAKRAITVAAAGAHNVLKLCPSDGHRVTLGEQRTVDPVVAGSSPVRLASQNPPAFADVCSFNPCVARRCATLQPNGSGPLAQKVTQTS
jgi:magnesium chelatase family protein